MRSNRKPNQSAEAATGYARLNCRVSARIKHEAEKAHSVLEKHERITLSERDFARFVASVENPTPPTTGLRTAINNYRRLKVANPKANL
jgi:hypothetical protein